MNVVDSTVALVCFFFLKASVCVRRFVQYVVHFHKKLCSTRSGPCESPPGQQSSFPRGGAGHTSSAGRLLRLRRSKNIIKCLKGHSGGSAEAPRTRLPHIVIDLTL